jgi:phosphinothricin acetyltransferase
VAKLRRAAPADAAALAAIYGHHVRTGAATFELDPPDAAEMDRRRAGIETQGYPYLVAEADGAVVGYAYASRFRPRIGYRFTVEDSVYIHPAHMGRGIGRLLLARLIEECEALGCRQMVAVIGDSANTASLRLHQSFGFLRVGVLEKVGWKFERWFDAVLMQRALGPIAPEDRGVPGR